MSGYNQDVCHVTLVGPAYFGPASPLIALLPWTQPEWRRIVLEFQVGTELCPDWDYANLCLTAIEELITNNLVEKTRKFTSLKVYQVVSSFKFVQFLKYGYLKDNVIILKLVDASVVV